MKYLLIFIITFLAYGGTEVEDAKTSIISLIQPLMGNGKGQRTKGIEKFSVESCEKKKIDWMKILLMKEEVTLDFSFKKNCDIQGKFSPKVFRPFPVDLKLRNIRSYDNLKTTNKITADLQNMPILNLEMKDGILSGKDKVKFEADYRLQLNPMAKDPIKKNLGGEIRIYEINGKRTDIKEKIFIQ